MWHDLTIASNNTLYCNYTSHYIIHYSIRLISGCAQFYVPSTACIKKREIFLKVEVFARKQNERDSENGTNSWEGASSYLRRVCVSLSYYAAQSNSGYKSSTRALRKFSRVAALLNISRVTGFVDLELESKTNGKRKREN